MSRAEYLKTWQAANRDKCGEYSRRYYYENRNLEADRARRYHEEHREEIHARKAKNREQANKVRRARRYGLTPEAWDALLDVQCGKCSICQRPFDEELKPNVDHDHETGRVRGLLCRDCNFAVGLLRDDVESFQRAILYLRR